MVYYWTGALAFAFTGFFFVPIFYKIRATSIYEYFDYRFHWAPLRVIAALLFLFNTVFYMSIVLYAPCVALSGVTNLPVWPFILVHIAAYPLPTVVFFWE